MGKLQSQKTPENRRISPSNYFSAVNSGDFMISCREEEARLELREKRRESLPKAIAQIGNFRGFSLVGSFLEFAILAVLACTNRVAKELLRLFSPIGSSRHFYSFEEPEGAWRCPTRKLYHGPGHTWGDNSTQCKVTRQDYFGSFIDLIYHAVMCPLKFDAKSSSMPPEIGG